MNRQERFLQRNRKVARAASRGRGGIESLRDKSSYREDAGWSMNDAEYAAYVENEGEFSTALGTDRESIATARGTNLESQSKVDALGKKNTLEGAWTTYKKNFIPVNIVDDNKIESTHYLPNEAILAMHDDVNKGYWGVYMDTPDGPVYNIDVKMREGMGKRGKELRDSMVQGEQAIKTKFYEMNAPDIAKGNKALGAMSTSLASERADIDVSEGELNTAVDTRATNKKMISDDYAQALKGRQNLMKVN